MTPVPAAAPIPCINLHPGEIYLARTPTLVKTILGSCVSVSFWSPHSGAGALCHAVLPRSPSGAVALDRYRYVDSVIRFLAQRFDAFGIPRVDLEIKLFGGADVLPVSAARAGRPTIGALNAQRALEVLAEEGFRVTASDLGGTRGRTIQFHSGTGEVLSRRLAPLASLEALEALKR